VAAPPPPTPAPRPAPARAQTRRWFEEALSDAHNGDVKQQALVSQMLQAGYGTERDPAAAARWADKARRRGYRMSGVYCEL
jgi:TPR repeat protein